MINVNERKDEKDLNEVLMMIEFDFLLAMKAPLS